MAQGMYVLICAPPGTGLRLATQRLERILEHMEVRDIEDALCESGETADALARIGVPGVPAGTKSISMYDVTWSLSRKEVAGLWEKAMTESQFQLSKSTKSMKAISCHLIYYCGRREEFYSPVRTSLLGQRLSPSHILVLIDDIYDMYVRLTARKALFDPKDRMPDYLARICEEEAIQTDALSQGDLAFLTSEWQVSVMTRLLLWRNLEIVMAEHLAHQLNAQFLVGGTKQLSAAVCSWLRLERPVAVYVSHAISRPRRERRRMGTWPPVVQEFNKLQAALLENQVICIMPPAIDEFRIQKESSMGSLQKRIPSLEERWPLIASINEILYSPEAGCDADQTSVLAPKKWDLAKHELVPYGPPSPDLSQKVDILLGALERQIEWQVAARDHLFVSWADGILVFRPLFSEGKWSSGVAAELRHWKLIATADNRKRIAFIHFEDDVQAFLKYYGSSERLKSDRLYETREVLVEQVSVKHRMDQSVVRAILNYLEGGKGFLDQGPATPTQIQPIAGRLAEYQEEAKEEWLRRKLRGQDLGLDGLKVEQSRVWRVSGYEELTGKFTEVAAFFKGIE